MSGLNTLAQQQNDLLQAIFTTNNIAAKAINTEAIDIKLPQIRGLQTYRANAHATALRSLQTTYPVVVQLIGDDAFEYLARDFWEQHLPTRGDLAQWGSELSGFIASIPELQTEPYLSDVASAEWALHKAAAAADSAADFATFSLLTERDPDTLTLQLSPGTALIHSKYPVASVLAAHLYGNPSFEEVGQKLRDDAAEIALVWRQGLRPRVALCAANEAAFVERLLAGESLLKALNASTSEHSSELMSPLDISVWLPLAAQNGLLLGAQLL
jgi:Putative DNA-binding domain